MGCALVSFETDPFIECDHGGSVLARHFSQILSAHPGALAFIFRLAWVPLNHPIDLERKRVTANESGLVDAESGQTLRNCWVPLTDLVQILEVLDTELIDLVLLDEEGLSYLGHICYFEYNLWQSFTVTSLGRSLPEITAGEAVDLPPRGEDWIEFASPGQQLNWNPALLPEILPLRATRLDTFFASRGFDEKKGLAGGSWTLGEGGLLIYDLWSEWPKEYPLVWSGRGEPPAWDPEMLGCYVYFGPDARLQQVGIRLSDVPWVFYGLSKA